MDSLILSIIQQHCRRIECAAGEWAAENSRATEEQHNKTKRKEKSDSNTEIYAHTTRTRTYAHDRHTTCDLRVDSYVEVSRSPLALSPKYIPATITTRVRRIRENENIIIRMRVL